MNTNVVSVLQVDHKIKLAVHWRLGLDQKIHSQYVEWQLLALLV